MKYAKWSSWQAVLGMVFAIAWWSTSAMAEGAIEGSAEMYEVPSGEAVEFAFSRFYSERPAAAAAGGLLLPAGEASAVDEASSETGIAFGQ